METIWHPSGLGTPTQPWPLRPSPPTANSSPSWCSKARRARLRFSGIWSCGSTTAAGRCVSSIARARTEVAEMFAVHTPGGLDRIEAAGGGLTVGQRMLRDAHGWDDENDRNNRRD